MTEPGKGSDVYKMNGAGEMLVFSAADFEDFLEPRPDLPPVMEAELKKVVGLLVAKRWPFRLHATYDESISPLPRRLRGGRPRSPVRRAALVLRPCRDRTRSATWSGSRRLGGGIAIQDRMAFQGEYFVERYGAGSGQADPADRPDAGAWGCRSAPAPTRRGSRATTPGSPCTGW